MERVYLHIEKLSDTAHSVDPHGTPMQMLLCLLAGIAAVSKEIGKDWRVVALAMIKLMEEKGKIEHEENSHE